LHFYLTNAAAYAEQVGLVASSKDVYVDNLTKLEELISRTATPSA
jgi:hypothetical protein